MMKRSGHAASINLVLGWPRWCQPAWHCPGTLRVPADNSSPPHKLLDQVLLLWQGALKTALVNIKVKSDAQLENPLEHQDQPRWLALRDRSAWLRQDSRQGSQPGRTGETCQKHTHTQRTCRDTTRQDGTRCSPCTKSILLNASSVAAHFSSEQSRGSQKITDVKTLSGSPRAALKFPWMTRTHHVQTIRLRASQLTAREKGCYIFYMERPQGTHRYLCVAM